MQDTQVEKKLSEAQTDPNTKTMNPGIPGSNNGSHEADSLDHEQPAVTQSPSPITGNTQAQGGTGLDSPRRPTSNQSTPVTPATTNARGRAANLFETEEVQQPSAAMENINDNGSTSFSVYAFYNSIDSDTPSVTRINRLFSYTEDKTELKFTTLTRQQLAFAIKIFQETHRNNTDIELTIRTLTIPIKTETGGRATLTVTLNGAGGINNDETKLVIDGMTQLDTLLVQYSANKALQQIDKKAKVKPRSFNLLLSDTNTPTLHNTSGIAPETPIKNDLSGSEDLSSSPLSVSSTQIPKDIKRNDIYFSPDISSLKRKDITIQSLEDLNRINKNRKIEILEKKGRGNRYKDIANRQKLSNVPSKKFHMKALAVVEQEIPIFYTLRKWWGDVTGKPSATIRNYTAVVNYLSAHTNALFEKLDTQTEFNTNGIDTGIFRPPTIKTSIPGVRHGIQDKEQYDEDFDEFITKTQRPFPSIEPKTQTEKATYVLANEYAMAKQRYR